MGYWANNDGLSTLKKTRIQFWMFIASKASRTYFSVNNLKEKLWLSFLWSFRKFPPISIQPSIIVNKLRSYCKERARWNKIMIKCINNGIFSHNEASVWINLLWQKGGSRTLQGFDSYPEFSRVPITMRKRGYIIIRFSLSDLSYTVIPQLLKSLPVRA